MKPNTRVLVAALASMSLLVAACGSDDDSPASDRTTTTAPSGNTDGAELTDSYRGVTADSIRVGVLLLDIEKLKESAGIELLYGDVESQYRQAIDTLNSNGGVLGRTIDPVFVYVDPLSETGYQEACLQLTEDEEIFAALGFVRPAESALCYTETGDTPFVGYLSDITKDVFERTVAPLVTSNPLPDRFDVALVDVVADTDAFEGKTIAILGNTDERNRVVTDALAGHGYDVTDAVITNAPTDDAVADAAELDVVVERWSSLGIDYVVDTTGLDRVLAAANRAGFEADWATNRGTVLSLTRFQSGATEAEIARTVVVNEPQVEIIYESGHDLTVACVDTWNENHPDEEAVFFPGEEDLDNLQRIARSCNQVQTFAMIAEAAGPDLTPDSFQSAIDSLGDYSVAMQPFASLSADKYDAGDLVALYTWSSAEQDFIAGDFIDIG